MHPEVFLQIVAVTCLVGMPRFPSEAGTCILNICSYKAQGTFVLPFAPLKLCLLPSHYERQGHWKAQVWYWHKLQEYSRVSLQVLVFLLFRKTGWRKGIQVLLMLMHVLQPGSSSFPNLSTLHTPFGLCTTPSFLLIHLSLMLSTNWNPQDMHCCCLHRKKKPHKLLWLAHLNS